MGDTTGGGVGDTAAVVFAAPEITDDDIAAVTRVLKGGWLTSGAEARALEEELARHLGVPHAVAMSSCTTALETCFAHLALPDGARVGVPTWTFAASAHAPARHGAQPVLLDVDPDTLNVSPASLEAALARGLAAVVVVPFAGVPVGRAVYDMCAAAAVPVVEDLAHAMGTVDHRGPAAGQGTAGGCLSFYATKNLTSGEGGALVTDDDELAAFARRHRLHGMTRDAWGRHGRPEDVGYDIASPGIKANLPDVLAALARSQLARFDDMQARRRAVEERYRANLAGLDGVDLVPAVLHGGSAHHLVVLRLAEGTSRAAVMAALDAAGIGTSVHFRPLHRMSWFRAAAEVGPSGVGTAEALAERIFSVPQHPGLSLAEVDRVCDALAAALRP